MFRWTVFLLCLLTGSGAVSASPSDPFTGGLFDLYEKNRREDVPNYITEDFLLLAYTLVERQATVDLEDREIAPRFGRLIDRLAAAVAAVPGEAPETLANRGYLALLQALLSGDAAKLAGAAAEERELVEKAAGLSGSPLWGYPIDYSQFSPRGRYAETLELQRYFRALRYANTALFAITATKATGVTEEGARRMALQARQLVGLMDGEPALRQLRVELMRLLTSRFGEGRDLRDSDLRNTQEAKAEALPLALRSLGRKPRILGGIVNIDLLEPPLTAEEALMGWRLIPASDTPESAAFQRLVHPGTGPWLGTECQGCEPAFGLGQVGGRQVKAYPSLLELLALLGSKEADGVLTAKGEKQFEGYGKAAGEAKALLHEAQGLQKARLDFIAQSTALPEGKKADERLRALRAFWTGLRYTEQLYVQQSYTPVGKGVTVPRPRAGARLERSTALYESLAALVDVQLSLGAKAPWDAFAAILKRLIEISGKQLPSGEDEVFLNGLDTQLLALTGGKDKPILVDIHTHGEEGKAVEEGIGFALIDQRDKARGARLYHREFKQPLAERMTDAAWAASLVR
ncbi:MAG: DUF3160 domain-containing protein [Gammaproteobacteria bacterium]|nr:DUF3160 domain-containing protein [Gammaproteobacteria bacterium]MBU1655488.1 DUF3160 domain-containing protein [Gammaproteobacteria bacterium]MBU1962264.1 DUF3160 domain-containing protein [Gammaproteobacteria bacterium]